MTPKPPSNGTLDTWERQVLERTNMHRAHHSAPAVSWNSTIQAFAQKWVNGCKFKHSGSTKYGENVWALGTGDGPPDPPGSFAIDDWYSEVKHYSFNKPGVIDGPNGEEMGHFTALVWVATTHIGCAKAVCLRGTIWPDMDAEFVSCNYYVPGNLYGPNNDVSYFKKNVLPYHA
ncbi:CAP domain-containing protein [Jimgerdemannia flammicorona]|uniref:CAP domain-containing protein n=1 Tax=Jimgerdemannia flammicorona TaxID=994334 RepID=A0A433QGB3_9FUNG|nr:CAP domain-containing protein [Jimgerdemannia flammicorona]